MKKVVFLIAMMSIALMACNKDDESLSQVNKNKVESNSNTNSSSNPNRGNKITSLSIDVTNYLDDFYDTEYEEGENIIVTSEGIDYQVKEIIVENDTRARGYITLNPAGDLVFFFDVDRDDFISTAHDIVDDSVIVSEDINFQSEYDSTNGYDVLDYLGDGDDDDDYPGRIFWGWEIVKVHPCDPVTHLQRTDRQHYAFWMKNGGIDYQYTPC